MISNSKTDIDCPACGAPNLELQPDALYHCDFCSSSFSLDAEACPTCGKMNLDANSHCRFCGASLTFVEAVLERHRGPGPPGWLENVRAQAGGIKATEAEASQRRMAALLEIDRKRKLAEAEAAARQREKDRRTMIILFSAAGLLLVLIAAIALAMSLRG